MRLDYTLTPADMREAVAPSNVTRAAWVGILTWLLYAALAAVMAADGLGWTAAVFRATGQSRPAEQNVWVSLAPSLVGVTLVIGTAVVERSRPGRRDPFGAAGRRRAANGVRTVHLAAVAWLAVANVPAIAVRWHPTPGQLLWAGCVPWCVYLAFTGVLYRTYPRQAADQLRAAAPSFGHRTVVDVAADGVAVTTDTAEHRFRWSHFVRYRETAGLLLLMESTDGLNLILPKRALADAAAEDVLRGLIQSHVADGTFLPRPIAFPVGTPR